jgi:hypothetical protein
MHSDTEALTNKSIFCHSLEYVYSFLFIAESLFDKLQLLFLHQCQILISMKPKKTVHVIPDFVQHKLTNTDLS